MSFDVFPHACDSYLFSLGGIYSTAALLVLKLSLSLSVSLLGGEVGGTEGEKLYKYMIRASELRMKLTSTLCCLKTAIACSYCRYILQADCQNNNH